MENDRKKGNVMCNYSCRWRALRVKGLEGGSNTCTAPAAAAVEVGVGVGVGKPWLAMTMLGTAPARSILGNSASV